MSTTTDFYKLIVPGIRKVLRETVQEYPNYIPYLFNTETSKMNSETDVDYSGISEFEKVGENGKVPYEDNNQGYITKYSFPTWKKGMQVSKELHDDDLSTKVSKMKAKALAASFMRTINDEAFSMFRNGFTTTSTSYGDAKPLFSVIHPRADGGATQSNASATGVTLTNDNLETAILALQQVLNHKGQLEERGFNQINLVIPPALRKTALEITDSDKVSGEISNTMNVYFNGKPWKVKTITPSNNVLFSRRYNLGIFICPWLSSLAGGSDTAWFLVEEGNHRLNYFTRENLSISSFIDEETDALKTKARCRFGKGWSDWRSTWGSKGDGVAYAY